MASRSDDTRPIQRPALGLQRRPTSRPNTAAGLVDLDNWHEADATRPVDVSLREVIAEVSQKLLEVEPVIGFISIRLYGGWTELGSFSQAASEVAAHIASLDPFPLPTPGGLIHGEIRLATALTVDPTIHLGDLCRIRMGPPRIKLAGTPRPDGCADHEGCAAKSVQRFTSKPTHVCPREGCSVLARDAFATRQQKMVDTLMTCDLVDLAHDPDVVAISVVTADTDLMPPLVHALVVGQPNLLLQTNLPYWPRSQLATLRGYGLTYFGPEGHDDEQP